MYFVCSLTVFIFFYFNYFCLLLAATTADVVPNGSLSGGQEPDKFNGDFDEKQALDGVLDEFRVWNYSRSAEEIAQNWDKSVDPASFGLAIYWK